MADDEQPSTSAAGAPKDPRKIARKYQLELCERAVEENIIVYLGTGTGKTHIAVLLIHELGHLIKRPENANVCVFLAPTVALVQQQAKVIEDSVDFKVGICSGNSKRLKSHEYWETEMRKYEVLVMTPQILLHCLSHCFIKMDSITLLIFDECHHAQVQSNHPYAEIMRVFYKSEVTKRPRVFGMTASPVVGKGASSEGNLARSINSLERLLDAKVYSVEDENDLDNFVASATVKIYHYGSVLNGTFNPYVECCSKLIDVKCECISTLGKGVEDDLQSRRSTKKLLNRLHDNMIFCLENLGIWGSLQATRILLNYSEWNELIDAEGECGIDSLCDRYLAQAAKILSSNCSRDGVESDLSSVSVLKEPYFSNKLLKLIGILSSTRLQPNMKCIIFVNRIITARSLSYILQNLEFLSSWKCDFLVGINSGLKSASRQAMNEILQKFRSGELNLLIATKVGEEGLDIQTCCLVIRFDLPETVSSFIQSRGRARMPFSEYAFLVDSGNQKDLDLIKNFQMNERQMNFEIASRTTNETFVGLEEKVYRVDSTGASISSAYSISLLHQYCSRLPHDEYFDPKPKFFFLDDVEGTICHVVLPSNASVHQIIGSPHSTEEDAKKDVCLKAIEELHKQGSFNDYLLPMQENENPVETELISSISNSGGSARVELHEMLVPVALKEPWNSSEVPIHLSSYYIEFTPVPADRNYSNFGLFVKANLPLEAEKMEIQLQLAHQRAVITKLVPAGITEFCDDEIILAEKFQEMILKVMLDRTAFVSEFVELGKTRSSLTFYLLLPVMFRNSDKSLSIDWKIIRKCLSSTIFKTPMITSENELFESDVHLHLYGGFRKISDVVNSFVYAPHSSEFYFIVDVAHEKNGHSPCEGSTLSHVDYFDTRYDIKLKYPEQPLLRAKPLFLLHNLLHNRIQDESGASHLDEYFIPLPPELCQLKITGFSKDIGSSISLLPSIMHRLENLLVAVELKNLLSDSFPEGSEVTVDRVLEALTTENCQERFSLERLEILGDAFLKFAVGRHLFLLHGTLDEGQLTNRRSNMVNNLHLFKLACKRNLQVFIRDQAFEPSQFFALGHPCPMACNDESKNDVHSEYLKCDLGKSNPIEFRCSKNHHWLHKKTVADVVEALIGAFIVDSGFKAAISFLRWIGIKVDFDSSQLVDACVASKKYAPLANLFDVGALEASFGYSFIHKGLLLQAFVHPSYNKHGGGCYQRLEFLGDAVMDYLITSYLYSVYPKLNPGQLTELRSAFVNNQAFANVALSQSFQNFLICDSSSLSKAISKYADFMKDPPSEKGLNGWPKCPKALGDVVESYVGAIYLDTGFDLDRIWKIMPSFLNPITSLSTSVISPVRELQELHQIHSRGSVFSVSKKGNMFVVEAKVQHEDFHITASATNTNIKEAKRIVSERLFAQLMDRGFVPNKSLEKVLTSSSKMEAKLIGCNETPIDVGPPPVSPTQPENLTPQEASIKRFAAKSSPATEITGESSIKRFAVNSSPATEITGEATPPANGNKPRDISTARSRLYEICAKNCWIAPVFECCDEAGPGHLKTFTCKVLVVMEDGPVPLFECFGLPHPKKKAAAECAAEAALWLLGKRGYL